MPVGRGLLSHHNLRYPEKFSFDFSLGQVVCLQAYLIDESGGPLDYLHAVGVQCTVFRANMAM